ncbi:unnamed protein product [Peronospora destructor]|uniref:Ysc84 actin-binding domain-containing protein n=1 Tax=Peronospora destructor TaxID=86335 RepID=A0AAV0V6H6_9STRA|nr:unnamed protein product [Peronospora destructor]
MLSRAATTDEELLCRTMKDVGPHLSSKEEAAALRERSNSLAVLESMRSHLPGNGKIGTGFVISRTTGGWSAPSFLTSGGFGFGMIAGGEVVNYMIILSSRSAVKVFTRNGQVQLGSELDIAVGPIGRATSAALNVGLGGIAPNFSYSHSKGLYGGVGLSGGVICTRKSLNARCYGPNITVRQLLGGEVACPLAEPLWRALDKALDMQREYVSVRRNLLVYSVGVHSGKRNTSQLIASTSMNNPTAAA